MNTEKNTNQKVSAPETRTEVELDAAFDNYDGCPTAGQDLAKHGLTHEREPQQLTCERCGNKTDAGAWLGFVYVGAECLTKEDKEDLEWVDAQLASRKQEAR